VPPRSPATRKRTAPRSSARATNPARSLVFMRISAKRALCSASVRRASKSSRARAATRRDAELSPRARRETPHGEHREAGADQAREDELQAAVERVVETLLAARRRLLDHALDVRQALVERRDRLAELVRGLRELLRGRGVLEDV